jgi:hypothetical protein
MSKNYRSILSSHHYETPHYSSPQASYIKLMQSSTRIIPERDVYLSHRTVNDMEGVVMRR